MVKGCLAKCVIAIFLSLPSAAAWACQGPTTYDLADPGASPRALRSEYWYFIGRILIVETKAEPDPATGFRTKVTFEILTDYRRKNKATAITAYVRPSSCDGTPKTGTVGKFGIDERSGTPILVHTRMFF